MKLTIKEVDNYNYTFTDDNGKIYSFNIEFYSNYKPQINDILYIDDNLIKDTNLYAFDEVYDAVNFDMKDFIKIVSNDESYYFQRRYG